MLETVFNKISSILPWGKSNELNKAKEMVDSFSVSNILNSFGNDNFTLPPLVKTENVGIPVNHSSPKQQIMALGQKYNIPFTGGDIDSYQQRVIKSVIMHKAMQLGVPLNVALGIAGNESGWKMWTNSNSGKLTEGKNVRNGLLSSTDWGAMQINDKAHPKAFPRAKHDLEYNIDYGLNFLANRNNKIKGSMGLGFGDWDRTIASYNLGHNPTSSRDYEIANKYVSRVKQKSTKV